MSVKRRIAGVVGLVVGLFLVISPFALDYPAKTQGVDDLTDRFRSTFRDDGLARIRSDMDEVNAFVTEFEQKAAPAIAQALTDAGVLKSADEFGPFVGENFPAVAAGLSQFDDPILPYFNTVVDGLEANQHDFERADAIPSSWLPATSVHWILVILGLVAIAISGWCLLGGGRIATASIGALGVAIIIVALVLQVPGKSKSVDNLTDDFRSVFSSQGAALTRDRFEVIKATGAELQGKMVPALADALKMTPEQLGRFLGGRFPAVAKGLGDLDGIVERFEGLVANVETSTEAFARADSIPTAGRATVWFPWHLLAPGIVLALAGGLGLTLGRARQPRYGAGSPAGAQPADRAGAQASLSSWAQSPEASGVDETSRNPAVAAKDEN